MRAIEVKNLSFNYGNIKVFNNLNLNVSEGQIVTVLGKNGSGKTTLAKILGGFIRSNTLFFGKKINKKDVCVVFDNIDYNGYVMNILINSIKGFSKKEVSDKVIELSKKIGFENILNRDFESICFFEKRLVNLCIGILKEPKILILDNALEGISNKERINILRILKRLKITIVNFTNNCIDTLISDEIIIIGDGKVILHGSKRKVLEDEKFFEKNDLELPFVINLSNKLKFYDLIDKVYFNEKKLVDDLWK